MLVLAMLLTDVLWSSRKRNLRTLIKRCRARQRGVLHVAIGSEDWDPTEEDMEKVRQLFEDARRDPTSALVVTRHTCASNGSSQFGARWLPTCPAVACP